MLHHSKAGKPRKGPQQTENTASVAKPFLLGNLGVSLHTRVHILGFPAAANFLWSRSHAPLLCSFAGSGRPELVPSENASSWLLGPSSLTLTAHQPAGPP